MLNRYNRIASIYGTLSTLVYGTSLLKIQEILIKQLPDVGELLILGGGNGDVLKLFYELKPHLKIVYQEASSKMIHLSRKKANENQIIEFVHSDSTDIYSDFNLIFCPFFLDQFSETELERFVVNSKKSAKWFVADFRLKGVKQFKLLRLFQITLSIIFFKLTTGHSTNHLPDIRGVFHKLGYNTLFTSDLSYGFYCAEVFESNKY